MPQSDHRAPMPLPTIAIIGRPNVGKSSLFNRLIGRPVAIVDPTAGVTRDRIYHPVRREGISFDLIDTGGIGIVDEAKLEQDIDIQISRAIELADHILLLCDVRDGISPLDQSIASRLRSHQDRVTLVVNKVDHDGLEHDIHEFGRLGLGEPLAVSAEQIRGFSDLLEHLAQRLPAINGADSDDSVAIKGDRLSICFAGRRNVGKSSLTNALLGEQRVIVADHPGTTRDAVDIALDHGEDRFLLIDTAGLRKKRQLHADLEFYAACRTERAIRRADIIFLVLDATDELGTVDKKLAHFCEVEGKPTAIIVNKWDLAEAEGAKLDDYKRWLSDRLPGLRFAPMITTCALTGMRVRDLLTLAKELHAEAAMRIPTADLNNLLEAAVSRRRPRRIGPSPTKCYYMTQAETSPPTFIVFVNRTDWMEPGYSRYLENYIRERSVLQRVPMRIIFKARDSQYHEHKDERLRTRAVNRADRHAGLIIPKSARRPGGKSGPGRGRKH
ncbi:MAG: ribosome biogenesis GTPase Der [Planctomycetota bacterium]|nr:MAG: ribosome biogenesis GTPase Der [Planctomycetota bacterium]